MTGLPRARLHYLEDVAEVHASAVALRRASWLISVLLAFLMLGVSPQSASSISIGLHYSTLTDGPSEWEAIGRSGATRFRIGVDWQVINDAGLSIGQDWKHGYAWESTYDKYFERAASDGITVLPVFAGRKTGGFKESRYYGWWEEAEWNEWFQFLWTFVQRYGHNGYFWASHPWLPYRPVDTWEVWNEPNLPVNNPPLPAEQCAALGGYPWDLEAQTCVQPKHYAEFLVASSNTIKNAQAQRSSVVPGVMIGGLYRETNTNPNTVATFLSKIASYPTLSNQFKAAFHGLSIHPYSFNGTEQERLNGMIDGVYTTYLALYNYIGNNSKSIWVTEMGWPVFGEGVAHVSELEQAELLRRSFDWLKSASPSYNIYASFWYFYRDSASTPFGFKWDRFTGLRRFDGTFRASWTKFQQQTGASSWLPTWHSNDNLGGNVTGDPDISSWAPGRLDVFARGQDGTLHHKWLVNNQTWSGWESLGGSLESGPGAVSWGNNRIDIVGRTASNNVTHWWFDGAWHSNDNLGGNVTGDPDVSSWAPGRLDVFAKGQDGTLHHKYLVNNQTWSGWESLGGSLASSPAAVSWGKNRIDVVARATDGSVLHWWFDGIAWHSNDNLGGNIVGSPDISSWGPGQLDVFARGPDGTLHHKAFVQNIGWTVNWESLGGSLASGPGAVSWGNNRIDVIGRTAGSNVTHWWYAP